MASESDPDLDQHAFLNDDVEELDASSVARSTLEEIADWKREAKAENSQRYFWHVREVDLISRGKKYFVIGRKGSGKTAICEHFNQQKAHNVFAEKLTFKQFPFIPARRSTQLFFCEMTFTKSFRIRTKINGAIFVETFSGITKRLND